MLRKKGDSKGFKIEEKFHSGVVKTAEGGYIYKASLQEGLVSKSGTSSFRNDYTMKDVPVSPWALGL